MIYNIPLNIYIIFILSLINLIFILFFTVIAENIGLIDKPTNRKIHKGNVPLIGGISIYSSFFFILFSFWYNFWT